MKRRRIIRNFFIGLLVVSTIVWAYSYFGAFSAEYHDQSLSAPEAVLPQSMTDPLPLSSGVSMSYGTFWIYRTAQGNWDQDGWCFDQERPSPRHADPLGEVPRKVLGFSYRRGSDDDGTGDDSSCVIGIPLWVPIVVFGIVVICIWQGSRRRKATEVGVCIAPSQRCAAFRRWLVRGVAISLLSLCLVGWISSYICDANVSCMGYDLWTLETGSGQIALEFIPGYREKYGWREGERIWHYSIAPPSNSGIRDNLDYTTRSKFLGFFHLGKNPYQPGRQAGGLPFWFPADLLLLLLFVVWRKTGSTKLQPALPVNPV